MIQRTGRPGGSGGIYMESGQREEGGNKDELGNYDGVIENNTKRAVKEFDAPSVGNSPPSQGLDEPHPRGRVMARKKRGPRSQGPEDRRTRWASRKLGGGEFIGCFESVSWSGERVESVWRDGVG
ncbi:hypothetical protein BO78DRAFT_77806 [Aspergillus sclerotiicarbonarius CBS 121057]|uniref:Uncharacterized protein n=1 Tax=Aspergillus sclerotiicarbonarius (strain CBS 121057 / IBT 28362) TaxID=1448318 RepID=A0A319EF98_ASPSB|nr:hypothetical protein BO78DRAFT_77806 [Aspergillus sclerotiicarbonarius CBS 121057]